MRLHRIVLQVVALIGIAAPVARTQQPIVAGTITGIVRDSASRPVPGADVIAHPGAHRTRTDSVGRFVLSDLGPDSYTVRARKLGYTPGDWDVKLSKAGHVDIQLILEHSMPLLDTVTVLAGQECALRTLEGFVCRRRDGGGLFLDYTDIDDKETLYSADLFRDLKGFRVAMRSTRFGPARVAQTSLMSGCITSLIDGMVESPANRIPEFSYDLVALEIYTKPDSVPKQFQRYTWPNGGVAQSGRCSVVAYWTQHARLKH